MNDADGSARTGTGSYRRLVRSLRERDEAIARAVADAVAEERAACAAEADRYRRWAIGRVIRDAIQARGTNKGTKVKGV